MLKTRISFFAELVQGFDLEPSQDHDLGKRDFGKIQIYNTEISDTVFFVNFVTFHTIKKKNLLDPVPFLTCTYRVLLLIKREVPQDTNAYRAYFSQKNFRKNGKGLPGRLSPVTGVCVLIGSHGYGARLARRPDHTWQSVTIIHKSINQLP
jgi:hypothetical protein